MPVNQKQLNEIKGKKKGHPWPEIQPSPEKLIPEVEPQIHPEVEPQKEINFPEREKQTECVPDSSPDATPLSPSVPEIEAPV